VFNRLESTADKKQAVKDIIGDNLNDKETQNILKHIDTKGKTDQQITSQVVGELDKLSSFSSDGLLESMFAKADNRKELIEVLLSTKFDEQEAKAIAKKIMQNNPDNARIVELLKQHYGENISGDDILENVLDRADNKQKAIETILASKLSDNKARLLANKIADKGNSKVELLKLMKSDADSRINQLLKTDNEVEQMKSKLHGIFNPLNSTFGLLDQLSNKQSKPDLLSGHSNLFGSSSLLDKLLNGKNLLDGIPDIPNPSQGRALSLGDSSDDFLSGLFDYEGNFDLPKAGEAAKKVALPFGASMIIMGGGIVWYVKHRKRKTKSQI
ncbi:MAG: GA module-containing protein, partial [Staphylococcus carnosus]